MIAKNLIIPLTVAVVTLLGLTGVEAYVSDRFNTSSVTTEEFAKDFSAVPMAFGEWEGVDNEVAEDVLEQAGAVGHVSRRYTNLNTGQTVDLWLIVGHSRDVIRHTPDICYPSQGSKAITTKSKFAVVPKTGEPGMFYTAVFEQQDEYRRSRVRVFWAWYSRKEGQQQWDAPDAAGLGSVLGLKGPRWYYGNNAALYKMYFTAPLMDNEEEIGDSAAVDFGKQILPLINQALFKGDSMAAGAQTTEDSGVEG